MLQKSITDFIVVENRKLNEDTFLLILKHPDILPQVEPGQFAEVLITGNPSVFLRRPISIHDADQKSQTITLFVKIAGKGTAHLSNISEGSLLNLVFPLGNSFTLLKKKKVLLAGGGCGVAPLLYLAKRLKEASCTVDFLLGARSSCDLLLKDTFAGYGTVYTATDDGTEGFKGFLTAHPLLTEQITDYDRVYTCGPELMMKSVAALCDKADISCEVSLENTMACGVGACLCCVVKTTEGHKCVCTEGPVFSSNQLTWQI